MANRIKRWNGSTWVAIYDEAAIPTATFGTVAVSGQSDVVSDALSDTINFAAGTGVTITTTAGTDTVTWAIGQSVAVSATPSFAAVKVADTNASHYLRIIAGSDLSADRDLTITTGDAARTLTLSASVTLDQSVATTSSPTFKGPLTITQVTGPSEGGQIDLIGGDNGGSTDYPNWSLDAYTNLFRITNSTASDVFAAINEYGQVTLGPSASSTAWTTGTRGVGGFGQGTVVVVEDDANSNAHLSIRHTNRGVTVTEGLDLVVSRADGTAFILQRENAELRLRTGATTHVILSHANSQVQFLDGTAALPSVSFQNDTDCGLYRIGANNIGLSVNAVLQLDISASSFKLPQSGTTSNTTTWRVGTSNAVERPTSTRSIKSDIRPIDGGWALAAIEALTPSRFTYKRMAGDSDFVASLRPLADHLGFIVEEIAALEPSLGLQLTEYEPHGGTLEEWTPYYWKEPHMIALCVAAIQELSARVRSLGS